MTNSSSDEIIAKHDDNAKKICMTWITIAMVKRKYYCTIIITIAILS